MTTPGELPFEIKLLIDPAQGKKVRGALGFEREQRRARVIYFLDTPGLELLERGLILRLRSTENRSGKMVGTTTVKLRPRTPDTVPDSWREITGFKAEIDRAGTREIPSIALTNQRAQPLIKLALDDDDVNFDALYSAIQHRFLLELQGFVDFDRVRPLGPIDGAVWKGVVAELGGELVLERWLVNGVRFLEVSMKVPGAMADATSKRLEAWLKKEGIDLDPEQRPKTRAALDLLREAPTS